MYERAIVNIFKGLNSQAAPELIDNGESRDILNFRMEKVGKLVSRYGYTCAVFLRNFQGALPVIQPQSDDYLICGGIVGLGEIVLSERWDALDSDRLMVYAIRSYRLLDPPGMNSGWPGWSGTGSGWGAGGTSGYTMHAQLSGRLNDGDATLGMGDRLQDVETLSRHQHAVCYLYVPQTGRFKDRIITDFVLWGTGAGQWTAGQYTMLPSHTRDLTPQGAGDRHVLLYAPNRTELRDIHFRSFDANGLNNIGVVTFNAALQPAPGNHGDYLTVLGGPYNSLGWLSGASGNTPYNNGLVAYDGDWIIYDASLPGWVLYPREEHWIDRYIDANQYRHMLVISDRVNGDMILEDEHDRAPFNQCERAPHKLHLRPNTKESTDIDTVILHDRTGGGEENCFATGVDTGMALYKYELPKSKFITTDDGNPHVVSEWSTYKLSPDDIGTTEERATAVKNVLNYMNNLPTKAALINHWSAFGIYAWDSHWIEDSHSVWSLNGAKNFIFTNRDEASEYDDVTGVLKLAEDEVRDEKTGLMVKEASANVFIWDDLVLNYRPCNGSSWSGNLFDFLSDIDRFFAKTLKGTARLKKLNAKDPLGRTVPLGIWKYRIVYDFGDGIYSAPSAELAAPDILWSAVNDSGCQDVSGNYQRKIEIAGTDQRGQFTPPVSPYTTPAVPARPVMTTTAGSLTLAAKRIYTLKDKIFGSGHRYGTKDMPATGTYTKDQLGRLGVMITASFGQESVECKGNIVDGTFIAINATSAQDMDTKIAPGAPLVQPWNPKLMVPTFKKAGVSYSYNSLFDDSGRLRLSYRVPPSGSGTYNAGLSDGQYAARTGAVSAIDLVVPGYASAWGSATLEDCRHECHDGGLVAWYYLVPAIFADHIKKMSSKDIWLNVTGDTRQYTQVTGDADSTVCDCNNTEDTEFGQTFIYGSNPAGSQDPAVIRPETVIRGVKEEGDRLVSVSADVPSEAMARLVLQGELGLNIVGNGDTVSFKNEYNLSQIIDDTFNFVTVSGYYYSSCHPPERRQAVPITEIVPGTAVLYFRPLENCYKYSGTSRRSFINNMAVTVYGSAERFIGIEQLTSYFPASLLFEAPRLGIEIRNEDIPKRAKKILIFRSRATHSNDWQPNEYGLVDTVDLTRENGTVVSQLILNGQSSKAPIFYYFDKVKDSDLDFTRSPEEYEGLRTPLNSRFNLALNENVYYANFTETYQPMNPRLAGLLSGYSGIRIQVSGWSGFSGFVSFTGTINTSWYSVVTAASGKSFTTAKTVRYLYVYQDEAGVFSTEEETPWLTVGVGQAVILYLMPSTFNNGIPSLKIYRDDGDNYWRYIGKIEPEDEGIFVDRDDYEGACQELECTKPSIENYESGIRWSEKYQPDWIKAENMGEIRSGDGDQITGMVSLYGNIVVFKENSLHRLAVQNTGGGNPISRVDEISPDVGCIAPNALITVNNTIFFLSWQGLMAYDNNQLKNIDGAFAEELQFVMRNCTELELRDASLGYNPANNEIYLNIPKLRTTDRTSEYYYGKENIYSYDRELLGHIYVISLDKGYATKYGYQPTIRQQPASGTDNWLQTPVMPQQFIRRYRVNSLGEMIGADILPTGRGGGKTISGTATGQSGQYLWAGIYRESPGHSGGDYTYLDADDIVDTDAVLSGYGGYAAWNRDRFGFSGWTASGVFPYTRPSPVYSENRSKFFNAGEMLRTRLRKFSMNVFTKYPFMAVNNAIYKDVPDPNQDPVTGMNTIYWAFGVGNADERITNRQFSLVSETFNYPGSVSSLHPITAASGFGTGTDIYTFVPRNPAMLSFQPPTPFTPVSGLWSDWEAKPIRFAVDIKSEGRTQINAMEYFWRPIHTYLE